MELHFNIYSLLIFLGAIQALVLCIALRRRNPKPRLALLFFLFFLFSLALNNLFFACMDLDLFRYYRALHSFPYPAKWILGPAAFYYLLFQFKAISIKDRRRVILAFVPAGIFALILLYGFVVSTLEDSYRVIGQMVQYHVFRIAEILSLCYIIGFMYLGVKLVEASREKYQEQFRFSANIQWLRQFAYGFLVLNIFNLTIVGVDLYLHNFQETLSWYYFVDISYTLFIYWIGFSGFARPKLLFATFEKGNTELLEKHREAIALIMKEEKLYQQPDLNLIKLAKALNLNPRLLSRIINEQYQQNFSDFVNQYRIEDIKGKLTDPEFSHYTILAIALEAGFNSKSTFNAAFKKNTGMTPSAYRNALGM